MSDAASPNDPRARTDLGTVVQQQLLDALGDDAGRRLRALRPAVQRLRALQQAGGRVGLDDAALRSAFVLAEHPQQVLLLARALASAGRRMLGLTSTRARVVLLDAAAGAALVALAHVASRTLPDLHHLEVDLVDHGDGWDRARAVTLDATLPRLWDGQVELRTHRLDVDDPAGLQAVCRLVGDADLVLLPAWPTADRASSGGPAAALHAVSGQRTRLLVWEAGTRPGRGRQPDDPAAQPPSGGDDDLLVLHDAPVRVPSAGVLPTLRTELFGDDPALVPGPQLHGRVRLTCRRSALGSEPASDLHLTASQRQALQAFDAFLDGERRIFVLHGAAGTGKTALIPELNDRATRRGLRPELLAPTGQGARRLEERIGQTGDTVHSRIYEYVGRQVHDEEHVPPTVRFRLCRPLGIPRLVVVDEASLVGDLPDEDTAPEIRFGEGRLLSDLLEDALHHPDSRVVFIGDGSQLPPVGEHACPALDTDGLHGRIGVPPGGAELVEVVRQDAGSAITALALRLRTSPTDEQEPVPAVLPDPAGGLRQIDRRSVSDELVNRAAAGSAVIVAARNADVHAWNRQVRVRLGRPKDRPVPEDLLVVVRTERRRGLLNGAQLRLLEVDDPPITISNRQGDVHLHRVLVAHDEPGIGPVVAPMLLVDELLHAAPVEAHQRVTRTLLVDFIVRTELRPKDPGFFEAYEADERVNALRCSYAYARTCHRAQGGEWDQVVIDAHGSRAHGPLQRRWLYTAVTRARHVAWIGGLGAPVTFDDAQLVSQAAHALAEVDAEVVGHRPLQHGVTLVVAAADPDGQPADDDSVLTVNLYRRGGLPSRVVPTGGPRPAFTGRVVATLEAWIETVRMQARPVPPELEELVGRLSVRLGAHGYDLQACSPADYQVTFALSALGRTERFTYHHRADGQLTGRLRGDASSDLYAILDAAIRQDIP